MLLISLEINFQLFLFALIVIKGLIVLWLFLLLHFKLLFSEMSDSPSASPKLPRAPLANAGELSSCTPHSINQSINQSGAVVFSVGDHDLPHMSIPCRF